MRAILCGGLLLLTGPAASAGAQEGSGPGAPVGAPWIPGPTPMPAALLPGLPEGPTSSTAPGLVDRCRPIRATSSACTSVLLMSWMYWSARTP